MRPRPWSPSSGRCWRWTPDWSLRRRAISVGGHLFARLMLRLKTHDATGGFRCYWRAVLWAVRWDQICPQGHGFQVGVVCYVEMLGFRIREFLTTFRDRRVGKSKMFGGIVREAFVYVLQLALSNSAFSPSPQ